MVSKTIYKKCYVFDFDECLVKTTARIHVYRYGAPFKSLTSKEYNYYHKHPKDTLNFSEFNDGERILNAKKYKVWPILKNISDAIKQERSSSVIYILTARNKNVKSYIYEYLKTNGILIDIDNIITIGDDKGDISIAEEKRKILIELSKKYNEIDFFDDDPHNIKLAASIPGIKTRLIENLINEKFSEESNPIQDMKIGLIHHWEILHAKVGEESSYNGSERYFATKRYPHEAHAIYQFIKNVIDTKDKSQNNIQKLFNEKMILQNNYLKYRYSGKIKLNIKKIIKALKIFYYIDVKDESKKSVNEKFTDESDPIHDMGIGLDRKREFNNDTEQILWIAKYLTHILRTKKIPIDIIRHRDKWINPKYGGIIEEYCKKYHKNTGRNVGASFSHYELHNKLLKKGYRVRQRVNEKFTDESDPIHDMGIGVMPLINKYFEGIRIDIKRLTDSEILGRLLNADKLDLADLFLQYKKDINVNDKKYDLLRIAAWKHKFDTLKFLIKHGGDLKKAYEFSKKIKETETAKNFKKFINKYKNIDMKNLNNNYLDEDMGGVSSPMATLGNVPGMGNAVPPSAKTGGVGSGDNWGNTIGGKPYTQSGEPKRKKKKVLTAKKKTKKLEEENLNPYDKLGMSMAKKMGVKPPFKKKKSSTNQNAMTQRKFEHEIITFDEFKKLNENKTI